MGAYKLTYLPPIPTGGEYLTFIRGTLPESLAQERDSLFDIVWKEFEQGQSLYDIPSLVANEIYAYRVHLRKIMGNYQVNQQQIEIKRIEALETYKTHTTLGVLFGFIQSVVRMEHRLYQQLSTVQGLAFETMYQEPIPATYQEAVFNIHGTREFLQDKDDTISASTKLAQQKMVRLSIAIEVCIILAFCIYEKQYSVSSNDIECISQFLQEQALEYFSILVLGSNAVALSRMESLTENWNGDNADAISEKAIDTAYILLMRNIPIRDIIASQGSLHVFPMRDGGVQFEIDNFGLPTEIEVHPNGIVEHITYNTEGVIIERKTLEV